MPLTKQLEEKLSRVRVEAWSQLPFYRTWMATLVWKRQGYTPMWNVKPFEGRNPSKPPFDIIGGMATYSVDADVAETAPTGILDTVYGCMFVHTSRYWWRSRSAIHEHGNGDIQQLPDWGRTLRQARRLDFAVDSLEGWLNKRFSNNEA